MRRVFLLTVAVAGCGLPESATKGGVGQDSVQADDSAVSDPLELRVAAVSTGVGGVQAVGAARSAVSDTGSWGPWDSGLDTGSTTPTAACEEGDVADLQSSALMSDHTAWYVVPPIFDLGYNEGEVGRVARPVTVVQVEASGCSELATLSDSASEGFLTGFASTVDGMSSRFVTASGLQISLVVQDDTLWLFSNNTQAWWQVDSTTGAVTEMAELSGFIGGAVADGSGGAWVSVLGKLPWPEDGRSPQDAELVHLDSTAVESGVRWTLPFVPETTGFGRLDEDPPVYDDGTFQTWLTPHFMWLDITLDDNGQLWVIHSETSEVAVVDPGSGSNTTYALPVLNPTAVAYEDGTLVVSAGLEADRASGTIYQTPSLYTVDAATGTATLALELPAPTDGWDLTRGFVSLSDMATSETRGVYRDAWMSMVGTGEGALLVADPKGGRLIVVE